MPPIRTVPCVNLLCGPFSRGYEAFSSPCADVLWASRGRCPRVPETSPARTWEGFLSSGLWGCGRCPRVPNTSPARTWEGFLWSGLWPTDILPDHTTVTNRLVQQSASKSNLEATSSDLAYSARRWQQGRRAEQTLQRPGALVSLLARRSRVAV